MPNNTNISPRGFTPGERKALRRLYGYRCADCGVQVDTGHADHIQPYSQGGATAPGNAQLLCPACNLSHGSKPKTAAGGFTIHKPPVPMGWLHKWQKDCLDAQLEAIRTGARQFFTAAGVGSGKSAQALALYLAHDFDLIIIVAPRTGIRGSWQDDGEKMGLDIQPVISGAGFDATRTTRPGGGSQYTMPNGYVLTPSVLPSVMGDMQLYCSKFKVLVVLDEAHHYGEGMEWFKSIEDAFVDAAFVMGMSGTPYRTDENQIACLEYKPVEGQEGVVMGIPHHTYPYEQAVSDGLVSVVTTRFIGGEVVQNNTNGTYVHYSYRDGDYSAFTRGGAPDYSMMGRRLRLTAVESEDWQHAAIRESRAALMEFRGDGNPWAGMIVAFTIQQAESLALHIEDTYGDKCMRIFDDADTTKSVREFNKDHSYRWAVTITKIGEGVSISRLRICTLLSTVTTRNQFEQFRGRIIRLFEGVSQLKQGAMMFVPADPRLIGYATSSNQIMLHTVPWLRDPEDEAPENVTGLDEVEVVDPVEEYKRMTGVEDETEDTPERDIEIAEQIEKIEDELVKPPEEITVDVGSYSLWAVARMNGAAIDDELISEDEYLALRKKLAGIIAHHEAMTLPGAGLPWLEEILDGGQT